MNSNLATRTLVTAIALAVGLAACTMGCAEDVGLVQAGRESPAAAGGLPVCDDLPDVDAPNAATFAGLQETYDLLATELPRGSVRGVAMLADKRRVALLVDDPRAEGEDARQSLDVELDPAHLCVGQFELANDLYQASQEVRSR